MLRGRRELIRSKPSDPPTRMTAGDIAILDEIPEYVAPSLSVNGSLPVSMVMCTLTYTFTGGYGFRYLRKGLQRDSAIRTSEKFTRFEVAPRDTEFLFATVSDAEHRAGAVDPAKLEAITKQFAATGHVTVGGVVRLRRL